MPIIGTAGHVDHGKSTLVLALTGTDPDRLAEEKRRGMTIDLGFAHIDLPTSGRTGIVDVPGHARFLHNMLAGVHCVNAVLLVVAADEGVMPQTREHLDILGLLGVTTMVVALAKIDLVDDELVGLAREDVREELAGRGMEAVVVPVSATRRLGLEELVNALDEAVAQAAIPDRGLARMPIDRTFSMPGFGTVVTGTLADGALQVGQQLDVLPGGDGRPLRVKVRGLQQHGEAVEAAGPGSRVAVNLQGIDHRELARGQVLAVPGTLRQTRRLDCRVKAVAGSSGLRHNSTVRAHVGTAEARARLILLDDGWVQLRLEKPVAVRDGDRLVLRRLSPSETLGGGEVVDAMPGLHRRGDAGTIAALVARSDGRGRVREEIRRAAAGTSLEALAVNLALDPTTVSEVVAYLAADGEVRLLDGRAWDVEVLRRYGRRAELELSAHHRRQPLLAGMGAEELRERMGLRGRAGADVISLLVEDGTVARTAGDDLALPGFAPALTTAQEQLARVVLERLARSPMAPPRSSELAADEDLPDVLQFLEREGRVVRVAPDLWLLPAAIASAEATLRAHLETGSEVTIAEARDLLGSSRKAVVPLLEYFDRAHLTVRSGDTRRLRVRSGQ